MTRFPFTLTMQCPKSLSSAGSRLSLLVACLLTLSFPSLFGQGAPATNSPNGVPVTVTARVGDSGAVVPNRFQGFSYELFNLIPNANGVRYFRADNKPLIELFRTLGIRSLRIGGNTGDRDFKQAPTEADIDSLFAFAKAVDAKVIYCLRLLGADPVEQIRVAKYIWEHYHDQLECFTIGQEPSAYPVGKLDTRRSEQRMGDANEKYRYEDFAANWARFNAALREACPGVKIGGPGVHRNPGWTLRFMADFGKTNGVTLVTAHLYPGGPGNKVVATPDIGRDRMLSGEFDQVYRSLADPVLPVTATNRLGFRIEEGNNYFNGGAKEVSDTFAAPLWGLDLLWWWASRGAEGFNLHTGDKVAAGNVLTSCGYASFYSVPEGVHAQPLAYGIKAFDLGARGRLVPVDVSSPVPVKLSVYASLDGRMLRVTLINRDHGPQASPLAVTLAAGDLSGPAESLALTAPSGDVAAKEGITLGGSAITADGGWKGTWTPVKTEGKERLQILVPPATAVIVRLPVGFPAGMHAAAPTPRPRVADNAVTPVGNCRHEELLSRIAETKGDVGLVLVGDSITDYWPLKGADSYAAFLPWKPLDLGVASERTEQVLWRLLNGELEGYRAKVVMIMVGTNNLRFLDEKPEWVAAGIRRIVETVRGKQPGARILLLGIFPRGAASTDPVRARIAEVNKLIAPLADGKDIVYLDIGAQFLDRDGNIPKEVMPDSIHPTAEGYRIWSAAVKPQLDAMMR